MTPRLRDDAGSAPAEFALVALLLVALTIGVVQVGAVLLVRNTALDAAAEGARYAALAGSSPEAGAARTRAVLTTALGHTYATDVRASSAMQGGAAVTEVTVVAPLPVIGLFGPTGGITVTGHAAMEPDLP